MKIPSIILSLFIDRIKALGKKLSQNIRKKIFSKGYT